MAEANIITPHMEIIGSDGAHVGTVDTVEGERIRLTPADGPDEVPRYVATALVQDIRGNAVTLTRPAADAITA